MKKVVFLCSGGGGNLRFLKTAIDEGLTKGLVVSGVVSDRACRAQEYAIRNELFNKIVAYNRDDDMELCSVLDELNPDLVVTNFHKILNKSLVDRYAGRLINLHYSLLPAFGGIIGDRPVKNALAAGCKFIGASTHFVEEAVDAGKIIGQVVIPSDTTIDFSIIMNRIFRIGCLLLLNSLYVSSGIGKNLGYTFADIEGTSSLFAPSLLFTTKQFDEAFWEQVK